MVLRGRDGAWLGASLIRRRDDPLAILTFKAEVNLARQAFEALAVAFLLTKGEEDVLYYLMTGQVPKEIASTLNVSEHTIRAHLRVIYAKMDVKGLTGAIRRASVLI